MVVSFCAVAFIHGHLRCPMCITVAFPYITTTYASLWPVHSNHIEYFFVFMWCMLMYAVNWFAISDVEYMGAARTYVSEIVDTPLAVAYC